MSKLTLVDVGNLIQADTAKSTINNNSQAIETAVENTLSRDGTSPNQMEATLDMNSNKIINLPQATTATEPVTYESFNNLVIRGGGIPIGGAINQTIAKISGQDYATAWVTSTPVAGTNIAVSGIFPPTVSTIVNPVFTTVNKLTLTQPATSATLTIANGKTLTASNTLTFTGTDDSSINFGTGGTISAGAYSGVISDFTGTLGTTHGGTGGTTPSGTLLDNISGFSSTGMLTRTGAGAYSFRSVTGTANQITVTNGDGVSGAPTVSLANSIALSGISLSGGTFTGASIASPTSITGLPSPSASSDAATKAYVDNLAVTGIVVHSPVAAATTAVLPNTPTYSNGTAGVGATLTAGSNAALVVDGYTVNNNDRVLVKNQASSFQNGVYVVTDKGSAGTPYILTRATDADTATSTEIATGLYVLVGNGSTYIGASFFLTTTGTITVGTTGLTFVQFSQTAGVASFNGRSGLVSPGSGDYSINQLAATTANRLYGTDGSGNSSPITLSGSLSLSAGVLSGPATGTSGHNLPFLDGANTWSANQIFGNVGIGTSPSYAFHAKVGTDSHVALRPATAFYGAGAGSVWQGLTDAVGYAPIGIEASKIILNGNSGGNVGIGTTTPSTALQVVGTVTATTFVGSGSGITGITAAPAGSSGQIQFNSGSGTTAADSKLYWDNTNKRLGIGGTSPTTLLEVDTVNSTVELAPTAPSNMRLVSGQAANPITADNAALLVSRREQLTGTVVENAAIRAINVGQGAITQGFGNTNGILAEAFQNGTGDVLGLGAKGIQNGASCAAFGGFFLAQANVSGGSAIAIETQTTNETGVNLGYNPSGAGAVMIGLDLAGGSSTGHLLGPAIQIRANPGQWDVGIGFMSFGAGIRTASIQDDTNSNTMWLAPSGAHGDGINWSGATFSSGCIRLPNNINIGVGAQTLTSNGFGVLNGGGFASTVTNNPSQTLTRLGSDGAIINFSRDGSTVASYISLTTTSASFVPPSDERLKINFRNFDSGNIIDNVRVGKYEWLKYPDKSGYGVIAQDVQKVYDHPDAVHEGEDGFLGLSYETLIPVLWAEVKNLRQEIKQLKIKMEIT